MKLTLIHFATCAALLLVGTAAPAPAQHLGDVQVRLDAEQLATRNPGGQNDRIFINEFDDFGGVLYTDDPGFESDSGALPGGIPVGFNVTQSLWYWNGEQILDAPASASIKISLGPVSPVFVSAESGAQAGFTIATTSSSGTIHTHLSYTLGPSDTPFGVYGMILEMASPEYESSEPFLVAFNYGLLDLDKFDAGVEAIALAAGIIELPGVPGDTDGDGAVDLEDLNNVRNHFGESGDPVFGDAFPFDGTVDLGDLNNVRNNFGAGSVAQAVPEPSTAALSAIIGLMFVTTIRFGRKPPSSSTLS
jgi:hypothetical protein